MVRPTVDAKRTNLKATAGDFSDDEFSGFGEPGQIQFMLDQEMSEDYILLACPGCGRVTGMHVGEQKPKQSPSWLMTGNRNQADSVSLSPSINCVGCCGWHGHLKNGVFVSC